MKHIIILLVTLFSLTGAAQNDVTATLISSKQVYAKGMDMEIFYEEENEVSFIFRAKNKTIERFQDDNDDSRLIYVKNVKEVGPHWLRYEGYDEKGSPIFLDTFSNPEDDIINHLRISFLKLGETESEDEWITIAHDIEVGTSQLKNRY